MSLIELENVAKSWGDATALHAVNLRIEPGSFCVLLGPSGCGKSTTLRMIAGLDIPTSGSVRIDGRDVTHLPPAERGIAMVFQNYALFPHLSVADNIQFGLRVRKLGKAEREQRLEQTAELLGLTALLERRPGQLSGGQQQRVALGRALVAQARVCLMDEPLSNLDAQLRQEMRAELRELQQRLGLTVVYVTHDQAEAMSMADQVVLLNKGRVEQAAGPREIYAKPATTFAARFIGTPAMNIVALQGNRIAGSDVVVAPDLVAGSAYPQTLGVRPEVIAVAGDADGGNEGLGNRIPATVQGFEYLGADLVLRCRVGSELLTARVPGHAHADLRPGQAVFLCWPQQAGHWFDAQGGRIHVCGQAVESARSLLAAA